MIIKIKGIYLGTQVENTSRYNFQLKKPLKKSPDWTKREEWAWHLRVPIGTLRVPIRHFPSVDWHNFEARPRNHQIKPKHIHFDFLGIKIWPNSYLIKPNLFFKHQASINRELKLEIRTAFFWLLSILTLKKFWKLYFRNFFYVKWPYLDP